MKFVIFIVLVNVLLVTVVSSDRFSEEWNKFKRDYNKHYASSEEETQRQQIFIENVNRIREYERTHPNLSFNIAINGLADRRTEELVSTSRMGLKTRPSTMGKSMKQQNLPDALDWRTKGVVSPVHSQGLSGDVAVIVGVEVVETLHAIRTKKLEEGSTARIDDCCPLYFEPFECIANLSGICRKVDYPKSTGQCLPNKCQPFARFDRIREMQTIDEKTMLEAIQESTLYAVLDASQASFQFYTKGVYKETECSQTAVNHALQIVGYGTSDDKESYWICKNSWGATTWGNQGYINILRDKNTCGISYQVIQVAMTNNDAKSWIHLNLFIIISCLFTSIILRR